MNEILELIPCVCFGLPCVVMIIFVVGGFMSDAKNYRKKYLKYLILRGIL